MHSNAKVLPIASQAVDTILHPLHSTHGNTNVPSIVISQTGQVSEEEYVATAAPLLQPMPGSGLLPIIG